jgi:hypothetical protein
VILVSGDERLREMVAKRVGDQQNVKLFSSMEELRGFINTLASDVSEEFVNKYRAAAKALFYTVNDQATLWYSKKVEQEIRRRFEAKLASPHAGATTVEQARWDLASPEFVKKKGQRIHWSSRFTIPLTAFRYETDPGLFMAGSSSSVSTYQSVPLSSVGFDMDAGSALNRYGTLMFFRSDPTPVQIVKAFTPSGMRRIEAHTGRAFVDVHWSVTVRTDGTLSAASVDGFSFVEATWT